MAKAVSTSKILQIYELYKQGKGFVEVKKISKVPAPSYVHDRLMEIMREEPTKINKRNKNYIEAALMIKGVSKMNHEPNHISDFKLNELEQAFGMFTDKVQSYIEYQVSRKVEAVERENKKLHRLVEDQERELLEIKEQAKNSNWISNLQKKFA